MIEIMVVIAILGLIAAVVGMGVMKNWSCARMDKAYLDLRSLESGLKIYALRKGRFPETREGLKALVLSGAVERLPDDPWGHPYVYLLDDGQPSLMSYGADGAAGGEGENADISLASGAPEC